MISHVALHRGRHRTDHAPSADFETSPHPVYILREHAWTRPCTDGTVVVGADEEFFSRAGQIVYLDLPEEGDEIACEQRCARSIDASGLVQTSFRCPLSGTVVEINEEVYHDPRQSVRDPYGNGWLFRVAPEGRPGFRPGNSRHGR